MPIALATLAALLILLAWRRSAARAIERRALLARPLGPDGVVPGAGEIRLRGGSAAVLLLHGGGDTPHSLRYLAADLHARGYSVHAPLLPGHGTTIRDFAHSTAERWLEAAADAYRALRGEHAWVAIVGQSMGGALAVQVATLAPELPALTLVAPYLAMPRVPQWVGRLAPLWSIIQPYPRSESAGSVHDPAERGQSLGYDFFPPRALRALQRTVRRAWAALPAVQAPTLVVQSREDNRIAPADAERAFARLGAPEKRLVWVEGAGHVLTVDYGREKLFQLVGAWLEEHGGAPAGGRPGAVNQ